MDSIHSCCRGIRVHLCIFWMPGAILLPHPGESPLQLESSPLLPVGRRTLSVTHSFPLGIGGERASQEGFPWWLSSKESACNARDPGDVGSVRDSGTSPGGRQWKPLQCSCLENPMDGGAWWATVYSVSKRRTWLKQLSKHACVSFPGSSLSCLCGSPINWT